MDPLLETVAALAAGIALSAVAGLRAFLPLFGLGLAARLGLVPLGEHFGWLASDAALVVFGTATVVESLADKVPVLDHALDVLGTVLRPAAGVLATAGLLGPLPPLAKAVIAITVGAGVAGAMHVAKAKTRVASSALSLGVANPLVSVAEDLAAVALVLLAILAPIVALAVVIAAAVGAALLVRAGIALVRRTRAARA